MFLKKYNLFLQHIGKRNYAYLHMLYFLCKSLVNQGESGKNVFDFIKNKDYNVKIEFNFARLWRRYRGDHGYGNQELHELYGGGEEGLAEHAGVL